MKRFNLLLLISVSMASLASVAKAAAVTTTFSQRILPLNCVFTVVNSGTQELHYVTPQACGVFVSSPSVTASTTGGQTGGSPSSATASPTISLQAASSGRSANGPLYSFQPFNSFASAKTVQPPRPQRSTIVRARGAVVIAASLFAIVALAILFI